MPMVRIVLMAGCLVIGGSGIGRPVAAEVLPPVVQIAQPPVLDGDLSDACWKASGWTGGMTLLNHPDQAATDETVIQIVHDETFLYVAARMHEREPDRLRVRRTERDDRIHLDDSLELFLDPTGQGVAYFHWVVNAAGALYDAERRQGGVVSDSTWQSGVRIATGREAHAWTLEMAIPLAELGVTASILAMRINVARNQFTGDTPVHSSLAPLSGSFHQPAFFLSLVFEAADFSHLQWEVRWLEGARVVRGDEGLVYRGRLHVINRTGRFRFMQVTAGWGQAADWRGTGGLDAGQGRHFDLDVPVADFGEQVLNMRLGSRDGGLWAMRQWQVALAYVPLAVHVDRPAYRQAIYATDSIDRIRGRLEKVDSVEDAGATYHLVLRDERGSALETQQLAAEFPMTPFALQVPEAVGRYTIEATLRMSGDREPIRADAQVQRFPPVASEVRLDEHGVTRINGQPFYPYGWFSAPADVVGPLGANVVIHYASYERSEERQRQIMDRMLQAGVRTLMFPYPEKVFNEPATWRQPLSDAEAEAIRTYVRKWKEHPALLAWYLADEPELRPALRERLEAIYRVVREADPYHPCVVLNDSIAGMRRYASAADILMPDPYPQFITGGHSARPLGYVGQFIQAIDELEGFHGKWITPQAFNFGDFGRANNREPNFRELRNMAYQAIIQGATGFVWFSHFRSNAYPQVQAGVHWLGRETALIQEAVLAPQVGVSLAHQPADAWIQTSYRVVNGRHYLLALSTHTQPLAVTLALPPGAPARWYVLGEGRSVTARDGALQDHFEVYGVHVYTDQKDLADQLSLEAMEGGRP